MSTDIVKNSFTYYDKNLEKYKNKFKNVTYIDFSTDINDTNRRTITMLDNNQNILFTLKYEIIGVFDNLSSTWTWAWAVPNLTKNTTYISRKILQYGLDMENSNLFLKKELITSRFKIFDEIQIDLHIAIASYISKVPIIYKFILSPQNFRNNFLKVCKNKEDLKSNFSVYYLFIFDD